MVWASRPPPPSTAAVHRRRPPPPSTAAVHRRRPPPPSTAAVHRRRPPPPSTGEEEQRDTILSKDLAAPPHVPTDLPAVRPCVVALAASAGGLNALSVILAALPADFPAPIVVVQHLSPDFPSQLPAILRRRTALQIKEVQEGDRLRAGWVYTAPPGRHLVVCPDETLSLSHSKKVHYSRPSADVMFQALADSVGGRAVGVVLTGGDSDGSEGVQAIKAAGGVTIAQDEASSEQPSMPRNAVATGDVDYVLPLADIGPLLIALAGGCGSPTAA